jgi:hypothetical protein
MLFSQPFAIHKRKKQGRPKSPPVRYINCFCELGKRTSHPCQLHLPLFDGIACSQFSLRELTICKQLCSELLWQTCLFENSVSGMSGFDFTVHRKANLRNWAKPNLVITLSLPFKAAASLSQNRFQLRREIGH